jgi:hypothetical protein
MAFSYIILRQNYDLEMLLSDKLVDNFIHKEYNFKNKFFGWMKPIEEQASTVKKILSTV